MINKINIISKEEGMTAIWATDPLVLPENI